MSFEYITHTRRKVLKKKTKINDHHKGNRHVFFFSTVANNSKKRSNFNAPLDLINTLNCPYVLCGSIVRGTYLHFKEIVSDNCVFFFSFR